MRRLSTLSLALGGLIAVVVARGKAKQRESSLWTEASERAAAVQMVETRGIEPLTPALQRRCSAN